MLGFKRWCREQKFNNGANLSHVLMDGGVLSVPFDRLDDFYDKYVEAVKASEKVYVVEQKTERYNFFLDIDYKDDRALTVEEVKGICRVICDKVSSLGGKDALVCVSPPKPVAGGKTKTGVHINWPGFIVNQASALAIREHVIVALVTAKGGVDWERTIDQAVYGEIEGRRRSKGSGFRMPWSHKVGKHDACGGKGCDACTKGRTTQVAYLPICIYKSGPVMSLFQNVSQEPSADILRMATVRSDATTCAVISSPNRTVKDGSFADMECLGGEDVTDQELIDMIEQLVRECVRGQNDANVKKVIKVEDTWLVSSDSKWCQNIERNHGSNHVYYTISNGMIRQKCHCKCDTMVGRIFGFCKYFTGDNVPVSSIPGLKERLYPDGFKPGAQAAKKKEQAAVDQEIKSSIETIVQRQFSGHERTKVVSMKKVGKTWKVATNSQYCSKIDACHTTMTQFVIEQISDGYFNGAACLRQDCECFNTKSKRKNMRRVLVDPTLDEKLFRQREKNKIM